MNSYEEIEVSELNAYLAKPNTLLVDVRNQDEVLLGVINGAVHMPLANLPTSYEELTDAETIIFYCHSGIRSAHAAAFITNQTSTKANVYNLIGGVVAWHQAGLQFVQLSK
jgi:rhodanese-related sulfurtransferase